MAVLAGRIPWAQIEAALAPAFARRNRQREVVCGSDLFGTTLEIAGAGVSAAGRPRLPIRLMAALLYLKHAFNLSNQFFAENRSRTMNRDSAIVIARASWFLAA